MDAFIGEIRPFAFNYPPRGWMFCNGQSLPIGEFTTLFAVIGLAYGGDGQSTFNLPNIQGLVLNGTGTDMYGNQYLIGKKGGSETALITQQTSPTHDHAFNAGFAAGLANKEINKPTAAGTAYLSNIFVENSATQSRPGAAYTNTDQPDTPLNADIINPLGGNQPHNNMGPYLPINYCICVTDGEFPIRS